VHGTDDSYYDRVRRWSTSAAYAAEIDAFGRRFQPAPAERLLDLGCGPGASLRWLASRGCDALGVDVSDAWRRQCAARPVAQADARALPFDDATFDGVLLMHVYAHLVVAAAVLEELRRVLRPDGRLGIVTPNRLFLHAMRLRPRWLVGYRPDLTVERHVTLSELRTQLEEVGFTVEQATTWGQRPWWAPFDRLRERLFVVVRR